MWLWIHKVLAGPTVRKLRKEITEFYQQHFGSNTIFFPNFNIWKDGGLPYVSNSFFKAKAKELQETLQVLKQYREYQRAVEAHYSKGPNWIHHTADGCSDVKYIGYELNLSFKLTPDALRERLKEVMEYVSQCRELTTLEIDYRKYFERAALRKAFLTTLEFYALTEYEQERYLYAIRQISVSHPPESLTKLLTENYFIIDGDISKGLDLRFDGRYWVLTTMVRNDNGESVVCVNQLKYVLVVSLDHAIQYIKTHHSLPDQRIPRRIAKCINTLLKMDPVLDRKVKES